MGLALTVGLIFNEIITHYWLSISPLNITPNPPSSLFHSTAKYDFSSAAKNVSFNNDVNNDTVVSNELSFAVRYSQNTYVFKSLMFIKNYC